MQNANYYTKPLNMAVGSSSSPRRHRRLPQQELSNNNNPTTPNSGTQVEVILGLRNDARYREIMYQQFNMLGTTRDAAREEMAAFDLFNMFQREGAQFYRMERNGKRTRLDDEEALKRITKHLKRRTESTHTWLGKSIDGNISHKQQDSEMSSQISMSKSTGECGDSNQDVVHTSCDHFNSTLTPRQFLHKNNAFLSTSRSVIDTPQDPAFIRNQSSNRKSPSELHTEEKKQDDDPMDLRTRSSSAALTNDNHCSMRSFDAGLAPHDVHQHVTESDVSSWEGNHSVDCQNDEPSREGKESLSEINEIPSFDRIILSLNDEYYKEIMWKHYRLLGKTRDSDREAQIGNEIFSTFKQSLSRSGRFFKRAQDQDFEVNDETALAKIIADIRRRMKNYPKWSGSLQSVSVKAQSTNRKPALVRKPPTESSPRQLRRDYRTEALTLQNDKSVSEKRSTRNFLKANDPALNFPKPSRDDTILCFSNEKYKEVMLRYFNILGNKQGGGKFKEENAAQQILRSMKKSMCKGGRFFTKMSHGDLLHPVDDERALQTISRDIKRRHEIIHKWLNHGVNDEVNIEPISQKNKATVSLPIARHHAWRDQLSASPIEVIGNDDCSIPIDLLTSEQSVPKSSFCPSLRQSTERKGRYKLCFLGEKVMEEYFQQVGEKIVENALRDGFCLDWKKPDSCGIFADAAPSIQDQHPGTESSNNAAKLSDIKSNFLRHFQINSARLADIQRNMNSSKDSEISAVQLSSVIKRVKIGSKDRVLCMVVDCEKHAQTKCTGCCTFHFRLLNSTAVIDKAVGYSSVLRTLPSKHHTQPRLLPATKDKLDKLHFKREGRTPSKETMTEILPPNQESIGFIPLPDSLLKSRVPVEVDYPVDEYQEISFINQIKSFPPALGEEYTSVDPPSNIMPTLPPKYQLLPGSDIKTSAKRSMITISPITTTQTEQVFNPRTSLHDQVQQRLVVASLSGSLDCLGCPGAEDSTITSATSPIGVQTMNALPPKSSAVENSAFTSPKMIARPPLFHQLYRPSATSPKRVHFPGIRSASAGQLCLKTEEPLSLRNCLQATTLTGAKIWHVPDAQKYAGAGKDDVPTNTRKSKRISQSMSPIEDLDISHSFRRSHVGQSTSALCHCPVCSRGYLNVQGMYAHYGRAHNGTLPWLEVKFSCPYCSTTSVSRPRLFGSFRDLEAHVNVKHPGCEVIGPHPSKLASAALNDDHSRSHTEATPNNVRMLRVRKLAAVGVGGSSGRHQLRAIDPKLVATKQSIQSWSKLEYPHYNSKDISLLDEQRRSQEEIVQAARDQRIILCRNEAETESKRFEEERLAYLRGIRERTRLADCERIEKQKFTEKADQLMMLYQYENRNRKRSREEVEFDKLCARSVKFSHETTRLVAREGKSCPDDHCQLCKEESKQARHLNLGRENEDRKKDLLLGNESPVNNVLLPSYRIVDDIFSINAGGDSVKEDATTVSSAKSRRAVSTAKRIKTEEDKLLMLKNTQLCLEFIKKYNSGMILNAWGGARKENRKRKAIA